MPHPPDSVANWPGTIERLLLHNEPDASMDWCLFRIRVRDDSGQIGVRILPSEEDARSIFASDGDKFIAPVLHMSVRHANGSMTEGSPPAFQPPIVSSEALPALGDENNVRDPDALAAEFSSRNVEFSEPLKDTDDGLRGRTQGR